MNFRRASYREGSAKGEGYFAVTGLHIHGAVGRWFSALSRGDAVISRHKGGGALENGGEGGIRTHGTIASTTVFETAPFDHSGTSPHVWSGVRRGV